MHGNKTWESVRDLVNKVSFHSQFSHVFNRPVATGGAGGERVPPLFGRSVNPISTRGAHYPHPVLCAPPDFQTLRRPCCATYGMLVRRRLQRINEPLRTGEFFCFPRPLPSFPNLKYCHISWKQNIMSEKCEHIDLGFFVSKANCR